MNFQRIIQFLLDKKYVLMFLLGIIMLSGLGQTLRLLKIDNSLAAWFSEEDRVYREYLAFQERQGSDEIMVVMVATPDVFAEKHIATLNTLHEKIDALPYVKTTFSLARAKYPLYSNRKLYYRNIYQPSRGKERIADLLGALPALERQLISDDQKNSFFYIQLIPSNQIENPRSQITTDIQALIESVVGQSPISGPPILNEAFNKTIYEESIFFAVVTVAVILGLLLFLLPHWHYLPLALFAITLPVSITLGMMASLGYSLNLISMLIPTILMVYCVCDLLHVINIFHLHRKENAHQSRSSQIKQALQQSLKPCFYTTLTTLIGYLALTVSPLPAFKTMGFFTTFGLLLAFCLVYVITTIGFSFLNEKSLEGKVKKVNILAITQKINYWTSTYNRPILWTGGVIFLLGFICLPFIEVSTNTLNLLKEGKVKTDLQAIEKTLGGSSRLQLNISRADNASILQKETLLNLEQFQEKLADNPLVAHPVSLVNFQSFLEKRMSTLSRFQSINFEKVLQENPAESNAIFSLYTEDYSTISVNINIKELESKDLAFLINGIKKDFDASFQADVYDLKIHGFTAIYARLDQFILQTQFQSVAIAFLLSFGILFYFIKNFKTTVLAFIPNLLPLLSILIIMAAFNIPLESANAMLAPIMLGVAMDDTIHLINKFKGYLDKDYTVSKSIDNALNYTGGALFSTTFSLTIGFLIVWLSGVPSVSTFGLLCSLAIIFALLADVFFLPALLKRSL